MLFIYSIFFKSALAGLDKFSYLDKVNIWIIERKIDSKTNRIYCRASIPKKGTWFSSRIRLDKKGDLVEPFQLKDKSYRSNKAILEVKDALNSCRNSGLIYLP